MSVIAKNDLVSRKTRRDRLKCKQRRDLRRMGEKGEPRESNDSGGLTSPDFVSFLVRSLETFPSARLLWWRTHRIFLRTRPSSRHAFHDDLDP